MSYELVRFLTNMHHDCKDSDLSQATAFGDPQSTARLPWFRIDYCLTPQFSKRSLLIPTRIVHAIRASASLLLSFDRMASRSASSTRLPRPLSCSLCLIPESLVDLIEELHDQQPSPWYSELEAIHRLVEEEEWKLLRANYGSKMARFASLRSIEILINWNMGPELREAWVGHICASCALGRVPM